MKRDRAKVILLEQKLIDAYRTIEFLHGCLTDQAYRYDHPEQTTAMLGEIESLVSIPTWCAHSRPKTGCVPCERSHADRIREKAARAVLGLKD